MMKSFSQVVALIPCPDSEAKNICPEFWPKREGYLARQLTPEQLQYFRRYFDTDMHKSITYDRWNKYFGISNVRKSIFQSVFYKKFCLNTCAASPLVGEHLSSASDSGSKRTRDPSPSQNEQSDDEGLQVLTPRTAAIVNPAHLVADLSPLLTVEVKRAIENGGESAIHTCPSYFPQSFKQLIESQTLIKTDQDRRRAGIPTYQNFDRLAEMLRKNEVVVVNTQKIASGCIEQMKSLIFRNVWKQLCDDEEAPSLTKTLGCLREYLS